LGFVSLLASAGETNYFVIEGV